MKRKKSNIDGGEPFPCFKSPVDPIFKELKSDILELTANIKLSIQIYIHYSRFNFDIGLHLCNFFRVVHV